MPPIFRPYGQHGLTPVTARPVRRAVRRWRHTRWGATAAAVLLTFSVVCDHSKVITPGASPAPELDGRAAHVSRVLDGDTFEIFDRGRKERVRLVGVDCPKSGHNGSPDAYWGPQATQYTRTRCEGKDVVLKFNGTETRDRSGRLLAIVYLSDTETLNLAVVRDGQAYVDRRFTSLVRPALARAEADARKAGRGLWQSVRDDQQPAWRQKWLQQPTE